MVTLLLLVVLAAALLLRRVLPAALTCLRVRSITSELPAPPGYPLFGNLLELACPLDELYDRINSNSQKYGPIYRLNLGHMTFVFVMDPDDMEAVLTSHKLTDKSMVYDALEPFVGSGLAVLGGNAWRRHRKAITPSLHLDILKDFVDIFDKRAVQFADQLGALADQGVAFDVTHLCGECANSTICETVMSTDVEDDDSDKRAFLAVLPRGLDLFMYRASRPWLQSMWIYSMTSTFAEFKRIQLIVKNFVGGIIHKKKSALVSKDAKPGKRVRMAFLDHVLTSEEGAVLSETELIEEVKTLVGIASGSSMDALTFIIYTLALRQDMQMAVLKELDDIFGGERGRPVQPSDLPHLQYTECFIKEVFRYFPVVPVFARSCPEDFRLPSGHTIPAGCQIAFWLPYVHKDPRWWSRPEEFDPSRFLPENSRGRHPFTFVPFSAGPRNCIGQRYAMMFLKTVVAVLVSRLRFAVPPDGPQSLEDVRLKMNLTTSVRNGANILVFRRPAASTHTVVAGKKHSMDKATKPYTSVGNHRPIRTHQHAPGDNHTLYGHIHP